MLYNAVDWFWRRYRPAEGWLSLFLLVAATVCLTSAITAAAWVEEDGVVAIAGVGGLLLGVVVAKGPLRPLAAWLLLLNYGLLVNAVYLGRLLPPLSAVLQGAGAAVFRRQWLLLSDRVAGWLLAVSRGESSNETIVFTFLLGLLTWLLAAYAAWSAYRRRRPLQALTVIALALAFNGYFSAGETPAWVTALFIALAALLTAALHYANLEHGWRSAGVDYSPEIRFELLAVAAGVAALLLTASLLLPAIHLRALASAFQQSAPVQEAEQTLERAFAGVRRPRGEVVATAGGAGVMPRAYLLGNAPELYETVVFTATVQPASTPWAHYWRGLSYDVYTGRGWALSSERSETLAPAQALPTLQGQRPVTQTVFRHAVDPRLRYTLGYPRAFQDAVTVYWRGSDDFSRVVGGGSSYIAFSTLPAPAVEALRQAGAPSELILSRYTALPSGVPARVRDLAAQITQGHATDYDRARALERFLRQYPYSLDVAAPPAARDPVDYFLFELQSGYCDYYASAMVVMARSLDMPARLVIGYLAQQPNAQGVQTMRQINAHAWPEIYFAGVGWVSFEPTPAFAASPEVEEGDPLAIEALPPGAAPAPPPIPEQDRAFAPWLPLLLLILLVAAWIWWLRRPRRAPPADALSRAYNSVRQSARRLGQQTPPSQTPLEFQEILLLRLQQWRQIPAIGCLLAGAAPVVAQIVALFTVRQYGRKDAARRPRVAIQAWQRPLRRLTIFSLLAKLLGVNRRRFTRER